MGSWMKKTIQFATNGKLYAVSYGGPDEDVVVIYDSATDKQVLKFEDRHGETFSLSPDSTQIATIYNGITIFDVKTGKEVWNFHPNFETIESMCFSPDGMLFAAAGEFETDCDYDDLNMTSVALWDVKAGKNLWEHRCGLFHKIKFSPDGEEIYAIGTADVNRNLTSKVSCAKTSKGGFQEIFREKLRLRFWDLDISPDGNSLVCSGGYYHYEQDKVPVIVVDLKSERKKIKDPHSTYFTKDELKRLNGHTDTVHCVVFSPNGKFIASASSDETIRIWDVETSEQLHEIKAYTRAITFSPDGSAFVFLHRGKLHFYNPSTWSLIKKKEINL